MSVGKWVKSNVDYGRRLAESGIEGVRSGQEEFFDGKPVTPFLEEVAKGAIVPAAIGAALGIVISYPLCRQKSKTAIFAYGLLGCAVGLGAGLAWESRELSASVAGNAMKKMGKVRDEQWLSKHPIDYA